MTRTARDVLDQEFLSIRAKLLEVAAFYDRLNSASTTKSKLDDTTAANAAQAPVQMDQSQMDQSQIGPVAAGQARLASPGLPDTHRRHAG